MAQILYSYDTWWPVVSNISTYKYTFNKIQDAPLNLLRNLTLFYTSGMAFYSAFWDYIVMTGITLVYLILLTGISALWRLWFVAKSFYWWLKALYLFTLGDKPWRWPIPMEAFEWKQPRRALRKLHPGISRTKLCQLAQLYQPSTHEQNSFQASIQQRRYTKHFRFMQEPAIIQHLWNMILHIWDDNPTAPQWNELNLILLSLVLMLGNQVVIFTIFCFRRIPVNIVLLLIKLPMWTLTRLVDVVASPFIEK